MPTTGRADARGGRHRKQSRLVFAQMMPPRSGVGKSRPDLNPTVIKGLRPVNIDQDRGKRPPSGAGGTGMDLGESPRRRGEGACRGEPAGARMASVRVRSAAGRKGRPDCRAVGLSRRWEAAVDAAGGSGGWIGREGNGAEGRTRTGMGCPTRPSTVRVYQFRHFGASGTLAQGWQCRVAAGAGHEDGYPPAASSPGRRPPVGPGRGVS